MSLPHFHAQVKSCEMFANIFHGEPGEKKPFPPSIYLDRKKNQLGRNYSRHRDRHTLEHNDLAKFALTFGFSNFSLTYNVFLTDKTICFRVLSIHKILVVQLKNKILTLVFRL